MRALYRSFLSDMKHLNVGVCQLWFKFSFLTSCPLVHAHRHCETSVTELTFPPCGTGAGHAAEDVINCFPLLHMAMCWCAQRHSSSRGFSHLLGMLRSCLVVTAQRRTSLMCWPTWWTGSARCQPRTQHSSTQEWGSSLFPCSFMAHWQNCLVSHRKLLPPLLTHVYHFYLKSFHSVLTQVFFCKLIHESCFLQVHPTTPPLLVLLNLYWGKGGRGGEGRMLEGPWVK